ncbi:UPF0489 family protein [Patescibacteria group bacterium]|nr:UPF0489 family protein [Patescibacteria group bacterium]
MTGPASNNAFSLEKRPHKSIYVGSLKEGAISDVKSGTDIVFEELDENGKLITCYGLKNFIKTRLDSAPAYIFDNHNHAFTFWCAELKSGGITAGASLIHIDQHKDCRKPASYLSTKELKDLKKVVRYVNTVLNVGNFIPPAQRAGLIKDTIIIDSRASMEAFRKKDSIPTNLILDIDLDFFSPEMDYIPSVDKVNFIRRLIPFASLITIATSPFFIDQNMALKRLREIADGLENHK